MTSPRMLMLSELCSTAWVLFPEFRLKQNEMISYVCWSI